MRTLLFAVLVCLSLAFPSSSTAQAGGGVPAEWNTRENIAAIGARLAEVKPILEQLKPALWVEKGAAEGYVQQFDSVKTELAGIEWSLNNLAGKPEKLSFAVDAYFRVQSFRAKLGSVNDAVRRYQNPAIAELVDAYLNESSATQIQLQQYLQELAELKEAELEVMESEAQRCRVQQIQRRPGQRQ